MDLVFLPLISLHPKRNDYGNHRPIMATAVIATQIARIGGCLIDIGLGRHRLTLVFQYHDGAISQEHHIWATGFHG